MGDLISRQEAIEWCLEGLNNMPSAEPKTDDENELKFYYVESIDDYWIGQRLDNFYYADWHEGLGFVWSKSRYLPWGEHVVNENTLWKEHTYPSEPIEIPFTEWIVGFVKKYSAKFCENRNAKCHSDCIEYIEWKRRLDTNNEVNKNARNESREFLDYKRAKITKERKR